MRGGGGGGGVCVVKSPFGSWRGLASQIEKAAEVSKTKKWDATRQEVKSVPAVPSQRQSDERTISESLGLNWSRVAMLNPYELFFFFYGAQSFYIMCDLSNTDCR